MKCKNCESVRLTGKYKEIGLCAVCFTKLGEGVFEYEPDDESPIEDVYEQAPETDVLSEPRKRIQVGPAIRL